MTQAQVSQWQCSHVLKQIAQAVRSVSLHPLLSTLNPLSLYRLFHPLDVSLLFSVMVLLVLVLCFAYWVAE